MSICWRSKMGLVLGLCGAVGCQSSVETASTGSGGQTSSSAATGSGGALPGTMTLSASIGPFHVMPGEENVQCVTINLKNSTSVFVRRFRTKLLAGSHHMIVYRTNAAENLTPTPCQSFAGILEGDRPIFIAQQAHSELDFPTESDGTPVGLELPPNQNLRLEMHYINATASAIDVTGTADMDVLPSTATIIKSDLAFWGTKNIQIPPYSEFDTGPIFQGALSGTKVFALTTHQHHMGTEMQVWYGAGVSDQSDRVADGTNWSDPPLEIFDPPLEFPTGENKGFTYDCHWHNTSASQVNFGESFNDEMCFLWHYYYPSQGFQYCVDDFCSAVP
jgi:hypothetical protein